MGMLRTTRSILQQAFVVGSLLVALAVIAPGTYRDLGAAIRAGLERIDVPLLDRAAWFGRLQLEGCCVQLDRSRRDCNRAIGWVIRQHQRKKRYRHLLDACVAAQIRLAHPGIPDGLTVIMNGLGRGQPAAARWWRRVGPHQSARRRREANRAALESEDVTAQQAALYVLYRTRLPAHSIPDGGRAAARALATSSIRRDRVIACWYLKTSEGSLERADVVALIPLVETPAVRPCVREVLIGEPENADLLRQAKVVVDKWTGHDDPQTRIAALEIALHTDSADDALFALAELATDDRWPIRNEAVRTLRRNEPQVRTHLASLPPPLRAATRRILNNTTHLRY